MKVEEGFEGQEVTKGPKKRFKGTFWERLIGLSNYDKYDRECECQKLYKKVKEKFNNK